MNVKKYTSGLPEASRKSFYKQVYRMHYSRNNEDLQFRIEEAKRLWVTTQIVRAPCKNFLDNGLLVRSLLGNA